MFPKYATILALASTALAAPLAAPLACGADSPMVTVTTYVTGYPPASTSISTSTSSSTTSTPTVIAYGDANGTPDNYNPHSPVKAPEAAAPTDIEAAPKPKTTPTSPPPPPTNYAQAPPPPAKTTTSSTSTSTPPPPPPASYVPAPAPQPTVPSSPQPTYGNAPPPPPGKGGSGTKSVTPHDKWSSSVGVVGCKINTNRVAYWPEYPDATRYCVKVSHKGRSVHLLHIDQSGGANDISYDAWNYLATGKSATESPHCGGGIDMQYEWVDNHACADLIFDEGGRLPLLASNPDLAIAAPEPKDQYVKLWNFKDLRCETGVDEPCELPNYAAGYNQAVCPSGLGMSTATTGYTFEDIPYVTSAGCPAAS